MGSSSDFHPLREKTRVLAYGPAVIAYLPSVPVIAVMFVPFTITTTPDRGVPVASVTVPLIMTCVAGPMAVTSINAMIDNSVFMTLKIWFLR